MHTNIDEFVPNYNKTCDICGANHTVSGMKNGELAYDGDMCGVCTWGESICIDPENWN